jgi:hypothetical protein
MAVKTPHAAARPIHFAFIADPSTDRFVCILANSPARPGSHQRKAAKMPGIAAPSPAHARASMWKLT